MKADDTPDPKLIAARDRITAIFEELDIAGMFVLHNEPNSFEAYTRLDTSYSVIAGAPPMLVVHSALEDYKGDLEAQRRDLEATANMVRGIAEITASSALAMLQLADVIDERTGAVHTPLRPVGKNAH
jgi:hypothetical protein